MEEQRVKKEEERKMRRETKIIRKKWSNAIEAENGSKYIIVKKGKGERPVSGAKLRVVYTGQFLDGRQFSSSSDEGKPVSTGEAEPFLFEVGKSRINPGLDGALMDMRKGEKRIVILPADLAYGTGGFYAREKKGEKRFVISPNTTLVYEIELLDIL